MDYLKQLLSTNEKVLFQTHQHMFVVLGHITRQLIILLVLIAGMLILTRQLPTSEYLWILQIAFAALSLIVLVFMLFDVLRWRTQRYIVTSRRVIHVRGIFNKKVLDSSLNKINDVELEQSWIGRIFNFGTIRILTATEDVINLMEMISAPIAFKRAMLDAKAVQEGETIPVAGVQQAAVSGGSAKQALQELAELKAQNLISEAEFEEKRKEILKRM